MAKHLVITGVSAIQAWDGGVRDFARSSRLRSTASFAATAQDLADFDALPQGCTEPVEILVGSAANRLHTSRWQASLRSTPLPVGSLYDVGGGRCITSPELFFLQTAPKLSMAGAVLLAMELCGYYSTLMSVPYRKYCDELARSGLYPRNAAPWPPESWGLSYEHQKDLMDLGFVNREPLTDPKKLRAYVERALSAGSHSRALVALQYAAAPSRSPMESRLYARYCLPVRYGGLNLTPVELNWEIELPEDIAAATGRTHYSVDLYWPDGGIAIEYQGDFAHSGLSAEQRDRLKRNILETTGIQIISIDKRQYANEELLDLYGRQIAKRLKIKRSRMGSGPKHRIARSALITELDAWDNDLYRPAT